MAPEVNRKVMGFRWKARPVRSFKFVDDSLMLAKINMQNSTYMQGTGKQEREKHDLLTQNIFRRVVRKARGRGMVVNSKKTSLLCMSDANTYSASAYILDGDGERLPSASKIKVFGFHLDRGPTVHAHVEALRLRMRETTWILRHLKTSGFTEIELARVYTTVIRPILDYCCVVYHSLLTDKQDQVIGRL